ncbi:7258_t:CDS:2, partial [Paraglomus occultum]
TDLSNSSATPLLELAQLFDTAADAEYYAIKANQKETLCWTNYGKEFIIQYNDLVKNSNGRIGEKKAKGVIYDKILEHLNIIRERRSKEMGLQLPEVSRKTLCKKTQKAVRTYKLFEKIGIDKIKKNFRGRDNYVPSNHMTEISTAFRQNQATKILPGSKKTLQEVSSSTTPPIQSSRISNSENIIDEDNKSLPEMVPKNSTKVSTLPEKEILIRNESDIDAIILILQQNFEKLPKKILDKWREGIAFEFCDNTKYWKKER